MKTFLTKHKRFLICAMLLMLFVATSYSQITQLATGDYNLSINNLTNPTRKTIEFDVWMEWTSTTQPVYTDEDIVCGTGLPVLKQRFGFFQAGINFNYAFLANGGVITGAYIGTAAERLLVGAGYPTPNWNVQQTSKQIRLLAAIISNACLGNEVPAAGVKLGKMRLTNTVDFATATPNFSFDYVGGTNKTQTKEAVYLWNPTLVNPDASIGGWQSGHLFVDVTGANHPPIPYILINPPCATANSGGPYVTCGDVQLNGSVQFTNGGTWSGGAGVFTPNANTINAVYTPTAAELISGVTLSLTPTPNNATSCGTGAVSTGLISFTSTNDNNICTMDGCNSITGVFNTPFTGAADDANPCTTGESCNAGTFVPGSETQTDDGNICTTDGCNSITGIFHNPAMEICINGIDDNCNGQIDESCSVTLNLKIFIEGFYLNNETMIAVADPTNYPTLCDTIVVELHNSISPYGLVHSVKNTINVNGNGQFVFPVDVLTHNYYIVVQHRNSIKTWSKTSVLFNGSVIDFDFTKQ